MLLKINSLNKKFNSNIIFQDFNLELKEKELIVITGNNGCGKSTLFNLIVGDITPDSGSIVFDKIDLGNLKTYQIAKLGIARTFQNGGLFQDLTVEQNIVLVVESQNKNNQKSSWWRGILPINYQKYNLQIQKILQEINLDGNQKQLVKNLSTGQSRLLELKKLELQKAKLYLIDEPSAGVNPKMYPAIINLIKKLNQNSAVIVIEHNENIIKGLEFAGPVKANLKVNLNFFGKY